MSKFKIAVIQFPGSNCERETCMAIERVGMQPVPFLWNTQRPLADFDGFVIIGGFSYEDRCRSGLIAAKDPLLNQLTEQAEQGKPVLGICNGAQILVESGLVPGIKQQSRYSLGAALTLNKRVDEAGHVVGTGFYNTWCYVKAKNHQPQSVFGSKLTMPMHIPLAHAEGRFVLTKETLAALEDSGASLWQYCDQSGNVDHHYPVNPNGSTENLAAISNPAGNVLAIMPHPERTPNGDVVFHSMRAYLESGKTVEAQPLAAQSVAVVKQSYQLGDAHQLLVKMIITDNEAVTVEKALRQLGFAVKVNKYIHWQLSSPQDNQTLAKAITETYELYNPSKEYLVAQYDAQNSYSCLVRNREDVLGQHKLAVLQQQCHMDHISALQYGVVWQVIPEDPADLAEIGAWLDQNNMLFNPLAHEVFDYAG